MSPKKSGFKWTAKRRYTAELLAEGYSIVETAARVGVTDRSIRRWNTDINFTAEVNRLTLMTGIANKAERVKIAKKIIREKLESELPTVKDLLEWVKYAQSETDGIKLDLTSLLDAAGLLAGSGQAGAAGEDEDDEPEDDQDRSPLRSGGAKAVP